MRVVLLLRCGEGEELSLVKLRSQIMKEILSIKAEFCSNADTIELFVPKPTYPVDATSSISLTDIACAIYCHEEGVHLDKDTPIKTTDLLYFEPYKFCNHKCLVDIHSHESCKVTQQFIDHVSDNISRVYDFCKMVLIVPLHKI